jgi:hypothetical protein
MIIYSACMQRLGVTGDPLRQAGTPLTPPCRRRRGHFSPKPCELDQLLTGRLWMPPSPILAKSANASSNTAGDLSVRPPRLQYGMGSRRCAALLAWSSLRH